MQYKVTLLWKGEKKVPYVQIVPTDPSWQKRSNGRLYEVCLRTGAASTATRWVSHSAPCIPSKKCPHHDECRIKRGSEKKDREKKEQFFVELEGSTTPKRLGSLLMGLDINDPTEMMLRIREAFHG